MSTFTEAEWTATLADEDQAADLLESLDAVYVIVNQITDAFAASPWIDILALIDDCLEALQPFCPAHQKVYDFVAGQRDLVASTVTQAA